MVLGYALLDEVEAYILGRDGHIRRVAQAGDTLPFKARPIHIASITLPIAIPTGVQTRVFLKIKTAGTFYSPIHLHSASDLVESVSANQVGNGLYFGVY